MVTLFSIDSGEPTASPVKRKPAGQQRPASATVRVPYLPSHVRTFQLRQVQS